LAIQQEGGSFEPAFRAMEAGIQQVRDSGLPLESILPESERGLGFAAKDVRDGESFWRVYGKVVRKKLCANNSKLRRQAEAGIQFTAGSIVATVMALLTLPPAAIGIATPIAAMIASLGIDAFCEYTKHSDGAS
jgi:hypothetical protein